MGLRDWIKRTFGTPGDAAGDAGSTPSASELAKQFGDPIDPGLRSPPTETPPDTSSPGAQPPAQPSAAPSGEPLRVPEAWIQRVTPAAGVPAATPPPLPVKPPGNRPAAAQPPPLPGGSKSPRPSPPTPPPPESLDYDLGPFTPISADELKSAANRLSSDWNARWLFGRISRIPPADDPRTRLIDRAMVTQGLLTPEQLAEIHAVGQAYDAVRPDLQVELAKARVAITRIEQERAERKARKQAEAAERKRLHAEGVARRRQTDIVFLGRGVSSLLHDRKSDEPRLTSAGLPVLSTPADVATALGLTISHLRWLAFHSEAATVSHYVRFTIPKRSGGTRQLAAPHERLAAAQRWILDNILSRVAVHDAAHGFVPGRSTVTNASPHVGRGLVINCDLKDFFPTITFGRVRGIFRQLGYSPAVATVLALLCTECPRQEVLYARRPFFVAAGPRALPQGACTSPALSNLASRRLDSRLSGIARQLGFTYTRYADDLTFSGDRSLEHLVGYLLARVRHITGDEGFGVNEAKTRVQRPHVAQQVTGIVVNDRPGVPRDVVRRLRAILHRAQTQGLAAQNRENIPHFEAWLRGMISYVHMVNPQQAKPLAEALARVSDQA